MLVVLGLTLLLIWGLRPSARIRWADERAITEIMSAGGKGEDSAAFALARQAEQMILNDPELMNVWPDISLEISVRTEPRGANVYMRDYRADERAWRGLAVHRFFAH